jgi:hypothetical protein
VLRIDVEIAQPAPRKRAHAQRIATTRAPSSFPGKSNEHENVRQRLLDVNFLFMSKSLI